jgi:hypothetical protein
MCAVKSKTVRWLNLKTLAEMLYHGASVKNKTKSNNLTVGDLGVKHGNQSPYLIEIRVKREDLWIVWTIPHDFSTSDHHLF